MQAKTIIIVPHENGWAVKADGMITHVVPAFGLALAVANRIPSEGEPTVLVQDLDGTPRPQTADPSPEPFGHDASSPAADKTASNDTPNVIVTEHISVPANINGEDMRVVREKKDKT